VGAQDRFGLWPNSSSSLAFSLMVSVAIFAPPVDAGGAFFVCTEESQTLDKGISEFL
jgi:hypothetical protein